jgi:hypothetical protein
MTCVGIAPLSIAAPIDFAAQIQPILKQNCYDCHGPQKQKGKLRLDSRELALSGGGSGPAIVPGDSAHSYLVKRILGEGDEDRMPIKRDPLSAEQIAMIKAWIDQGAKWPDEANIAGASINKHWAYQKPVRPELPKVNDATWPRNAIDSFILARLEHEGLHPSPEADRVTLIRRLSLDLIGLPPTIAEVDAFVADSSPRAYENLVDRLLASPHYGERWGRHWLDLARYADTNGYEKDRTRSIWPYRDWVIHALNADMPFDQFTIEQLAGDMLPNTTPSQRIATGFHRNTMINEEGGIDVEEFRYKAMVDRVQTTATTWLGTTLHCAQCHNHKYDPFTQKEYYQLYALLNNADEPTMDVPDEEIAGKRREIEAKIAKIESEYAEHFPTAEEVGPIEWTVLVPSSVAARDRTRLKVQADGSVLAGGPNPATESYTLSGDLAPGQIDALRIEALTDPSLPRTGPGRAPHGNFVLSELKATVEGQAPLRFSSASADFAQANFPASAAIDGDPNTGWAIDDGSGSLNKPRTATFTLAAPLKLDAPTKLTITLDQNHPHHGLGRFRISLGRKRLVDPNGPKLTREQFLGQKLNEWESSMKPRCAHWTVLEPTKFSRNYGGTITKLADHSLLFTGDNFYRDEYKLEFALPPDVRKITAIRMEVLPDPSQPKGGPGRNPDGGWLVSEFSVANANSPLTLQGATADIGGHPEYAIDGKRDSHWQQGAGDGRPHEIVFQVKHGPLASGALLISVLQNYHQQENVGRLRISVTSDAGDDIRASGLPADIESIVLRSADRTPQQQVALRDYFLATTPLLAAEHLKVAELRKAMPQYATTMVMQERPAAAGPRVTHIHRRGEFLTLGAEVQPSVPAVLPPLPPDQPRNRLAFARWLVSANNPLTPRVIMNRVWANYFGRGIVRSVEDFGTMGEAPSHPELLDWLATEFIRQHWSLKAMHRLIVTSATYRQSSRVPGNLLERDPDNTILARGPRLRVEAEIIRDIALRASGLLNETIGGPSVYPPQPEGVSEQSWANTPWPESKGPDRFRRGMYTFLKRTAPHPQLVTFDAPTSEVVCPRRIRSDTPLQALTVLNDAAFVEAAQALARRIVSEGPKDAAGRATFAFGLCLSRAPDERELEKLVQFHQEQVDQFRQHPEQAKQVAISEAVPAVQDADVADLAAWTVVSRSVLNLDETITKE